MIREKRALIPVSILFIVMGAIVLISLLMFGKFGAFDSSIPFFDNLPDFKKDNKTVKIEVIFRYQINEEGKYQLERHDGKGDEEGIVQYYDGTRWNDFEGEYYEINGKKFEYNALLRDFRNYYFNTPREKVEPRVFLWADKDKEKYLGKESNQRFRFAILDKNLASDTRINPDDLAVQYGTIIHIQKPAADTSYYPFYFIYSLDGQLYASKLDKSAVKSLTSLPGSIFKRLRSVISSDENFVMDDNGVPYSFDISNEPYNQVAQYAREWREGVTYAPIIISYFDSKQNKNLNGYYRARAIEEDIVVDLSDILSERAAIKVAVFDESDYEGYAFINEVDGEEVMLG